MFVSAAAGAVGSAVVQIAKAKGMTVIGSAGGADKCAFVRELGADQVIDYKAGPLVKSLAAAAPDGIDVYFDNVGGDHLDAAFARARLHARFALCGMIGGYNSREPMAFKYIIRVIAMRRVVVSSSRGSQTNANRWRCSAPGSSKSAGRGRSARLIAVRAAARTFCKPDSVGW